MGYNAWYIFTRLQKYGKLQKKKKIPQSFENQQQGQECGSAVKQLSCIILGPWVQPPGTSKTKQNKNPTCIQENQQHIKPPYCPETKAVY